MKIFRFLVSTKISLVLLLVFSVAMAAATFMENDHGTAVARQVIYEAWWFEVILVWLAINFVFHIDKYKLFSAKRWPIGLFHVAFILIIIGAGITRYISDEGIVPIREGDTATQYFSSEKYLQVVGPNHYSAKKEIGLIPYQFEPQTHEIKIAEGELTFKFNDFIENARETFVPGNQTLLDLAIADGNGRQDVILKIDDQLEAAGQVISFGDKYEDGIQIKKIDSVWHIKSPVTMHLMEMSTQALGALIENEWQPVKLRNLYQWDSGTMMIKGIHEDAKRAYVTEPNQEIADNFPSVVQISVIDENDKLIKEDFVRLTTRKSQWIEMQLNNQTYHFTYGPDVVSLPFGLRLDEFELDRYPGSESPSSYASRITVIDQESGNFPYRIYMNNVLDHKGYRFYQASYDTDEKGTLLQVNRDRIGTITTYIGYTLLIIGMFGTFFIKKSRFGILRRKLNKLQASSLVLVMLMTGSFVNAQEQAQQNKYPDISANIPPVKEADAYGRLIVQDLDGRMKPLSTLAYEIVRKLVGKTNVEVPQTNGNINLTPEQFLLALQLAPEEFSEIPLIKVEEKHSTEVYRKLNVEPSKQLSFKDFIAKNGDYLLSDLVESASRLKPSERAEADNEVLKTDERFNIFYGITTGEFLRLFPNKNDENDRWHTSHESHAGFDKEDAAFVENIARLYLQRLQEGIITGDFSKAHEALNYIDQFQRQAGESVYPGETEIEAELFYTKAQIGNMLFGVLILLGVIMLILAIFKLFYQNKALDISWQIGSALGWIGLIVFTFNLGLRWYIAKHPPWSDGFEMLLFVSWGVLLSGLLFSRKSAFTLALGLLFSGVLLFVAFLDWLNPEITNLMPVLHSYWLKIHVAVIVGSYAPLALAAIIALLSLLLLVFKPAKPQTRWWNSLRELIIVNELSISIGLFLLAAGTFLGGVWANESWGRYWAWDPKETWALISIIIYSIVIHLRLIPAFKNALIYNLASLWAFASIIMTSYGVNYYLSGLHSYASGDPVPIPAWVYWTTALLVLISILATFRYYKLSKEERKLLF